MCKGNQIHSGISICMCIAFGFVVVHMCTDPITSDKQMKCIIEKRARILLKMEMRFRTCTSKCMCSYNYIWVCICMCITFGFIGVHMCTEPITSGEHMKCMVEKRARILFKVEARLFSWSKNVSGSYGSVRSPKKVLADPIIKARHVNIRARILFTP
jgi:hypothetical protein